MPAVVNAWGRRRSPQRRGRQRTNPGTAASFWQTGCPVHVLHPCVTARYASRAPSVARTTRRRCPGQTRSIPSRVIQKRTRAAGPSGMAPSPPIPPTSPNLIHDGSPVFHEERSRPMQRLQVSLFHRLIETNAWWPTHRFADRFRISSIILVGLDVGLTYWGASA